MYKMGFNKIAFAILALTVGLLARDGNYAEAIKYYQDGMYNKAFPIIAAEAQKDNKAAQYRLAEMYEKGKGNYKILGKFFTLI